jgi:sporulation protein YlmC with PRC-barrel domain
MIPQGSKVYTSDGKSVGNVIDVNSEYFTSRKRDLITDEEYRIPLHAISYIEPAPGDMIIVRLSLNKEQLQHGREFVKGKPNSDFISGRSEFEAKIVSEKPLIHYEAMEPLEENISFPSSRAGLPKDIEYKCDMCEERFDDSKSLQEHRAGEHKGPIGL